MEPVENPWAEIAIEQNRRWLRAYILSATGDHSACDDLVQEVFTIAYRKRDAFTLGTNFGGWLRNIARNVILQHCRKRQRQPLFSHDDAVGTLDRVAAEEEECCRDPIFVQRRQQLMRECLQAITRRVHEVLRLRYAENRPTQMVAKLLHMSVTAVNVAAFRGRLAVAQCVENKEKAGVA